ncbi:uncharacterized mitochondrial protein AtMg00810-like [Arachis duranensis]|uniref:Uncharacterized mitochondrial protein AtMg00810-like n=1 Tax=Arachis duranensis TaxID=130453 RepID=A0A6P4BK10_ARADU|nr:uncharacterized mitochondrial protein AtMg00810-like [Arachis duranensis]XP_025616587.1 uncharacterized protein LOC112708877 [Arachis hypogaea]
MATTDSEEANEELRTQLEEDENISSGFTASQREVLLALLNKHEVKNIYSTNQIVTQQRSHPHQELDALEHLQTWQITSLPPREKAIGYKWVFKLKHNPDGSIERHKARLVAKDDVVLVGNDLVKIDSIKALLNACFKIKDIGDLKFFLGIEVARSKQGVALYQRKYALDLLREAGFEDCKPISNPMDYNVKLTKDVGSSLPDNAEYRKLIGKLLYLTNTRPNISFAVRKLSQFLDKPTDLHLRAAHRILRYIKSVPAKGLFFPSQSDLHVTGFSDSDWAACPDSRRSITAYCFYIGSSIVS